MSAERDSLFTSLRLRLARYVMPRGYAIWTWGDDSWDEPIAKKEKR